MDITALIQAGNSVLTSTLAGISRISAQRKQDKAVYKIQYVK